MTYFQKYIVSNPISLSSGRRLLFQSIGNDQGIIALDDAAVISEVRSLIDRQIGGIVEITAEQFEDLKKKVAPNSPPRSTLSAPPEWPTYRVTQRGEPRVAADPHVIPSPTQQVLAPSTPEASESKVPKAPAANRPVPRKLAKPGTDS